jgi:hypothetical protein
MFYVQVDDMIVMKTVCLQTIDVYYFGGCVPVIVTDQVSVCYLVR